MTMLGEPWTTTQINKVRALASEGFSATEIGHVLGRSYYSVRRICVIHGIQPPHGHRATAGDGMVATHKLAIACNTVIERWALANNKTHEEALEILLGGAVKKPTPGTERIYRGQLAERALAA